jgi:hypothetical protein
LKKVDNKSANLNNSRRSVSVGRSFIEKDKDKEKKSHGKMEAFANRKSINLDRSGGTDEKKNTARSTSKSTIIKKINFDSSDKNDKKKSVADNSPKVGSRRLPPKNVVSTKPLASPKKPPVTAPLKGKVVAKPVVKVGAKKGEVKKGMNEIK